MSNEIDVYEERGRLFFSKDENQSRDTVNPQGVACVIREHYSIRTLLDTEEMFYYEDGIYVPGAEAFIKHLCETLLGEKATNHIVNEVIGHIKRVTYFDRSFAQDGTNSICLLNGIINIETGKWRPHSPDEVFFTRLNAVYDSDAECPEIDNFIEEILAKDDRALAFELIAYTLIPGYPIQKAAGLIGGGSNGKSTLLSLIKSFLGPNNVSAVALQDLDNDRFASASLYRKRANICADLPSKDLHRTSMFKALTGGDRIRAQFKNQNAFEFENQAKLLFSMNQVPLSQDDSDAFYRRWVLIDFPNKFEGKNLDMNKLEKITTPGERSGLLNKCLGIVPQILKRQGFSNAGSIEATREKYLKLSDSVYCFLDDQCLIKAGFYDSEKGTIEEPGIIRKRDLFEKYKDWCMAHTVTAIRDKGFNKRLLEFAPSISEVRIKDSGQSVRAWRGIALKDADEIQEDRAQKTLRGFQ